MPNSTMIRIWIRTIKLGVQVESKLILDRHFFMAKVLKAKTA